MNIKNTSSSHCIVLNHYYCCIYMFILISIIYNNIIIKLPLPPQPPWDRHQMRILKVQLKDINHVVTKAFFDD